MEDWKIIKARKKVRRMKGFYGHFTSWAIFSGFFIMLNLWTDPHDFWAIFPIASWGAGVLFHAVGVFGLPWLGSDWEERELRRELDRLEKHEQLRHRIDEHQGGASPSSQYMRLEDPPLKLKRLRKGNRDSDFV